MTVYQEGSKMTATPTDQVPLIDLALHVHDVNAANGWFDQERTNGEGLALLHSEVSEALEAYRDHGLADVTIGEPIRLEDGTLIVPKPEGFGSELADVLIRLLDTLHRRGGGPQALRHHPGDRPGLASIHSDHLHRRRLPGVPPQTDRPRRPATPAHRPRGTRLDHRRRPSRRVRPEDGLQRHPRPPARREAPVIRPAAADPFLVDVVANLAGLDPELVVVGPTRVVIDGDGHPGAVLVAHVTLDRDEVLALAEQHGVVGRP